MGRLPDSVFKERMPIRQGLLVFVNDAQDRSVPLQFYAGCYVPADSLCWNCQVPMVLNSHDGGLWRSLMSVRQVHMTFE
jgi:hypothetical protein